MKKLIIQSNESITVPVTDKVIPKTPNKSKVKNYGKREGWKAKQTWEAKPKTNTQYIPHPQVTTAVTPIVTPIQDIQAPIVILPQETPKVETVIEDIKVQSVPVETHIIPKQVPNTQNKFVQPLNKFNADMTGRIPVKPPQRHWSAPMDLPGMDNKFYNFALPQGMPLPPMMSDIPRDNQYSTHSTPLWHYMSPMGPVMPSGYSMPKTPIPLNKRPVPPGKMDNLIRLPVAYPMAPIIDYNALPLLSTGIPIQIDNLSYGTPFVKSEEKLNTVKRNEANKNSKNIPQKRGSNNNQFQYHSQPNLQPNMQPINLPLNMQPMQPNNLPLNMHPNIQPMVNPISNIIPVTQPTFNGNTKYNNLRNSTNSINSRIPSPKVNSLRNSKGRGQTALIYKPKEKTREESSVNNTVAKIVTSNGGS